MMQKGFFVRGGISIGSFYSDKNMIFSGGLVSAYRLEKATVYPVIGIDRETLSRLSNNFKQYSVGLFFEKSIIYSPEEPEKIFFNPFDILDNSSNYFDYIQTTLNSILDEDENEVLSNPILNMTSYIVNPIFEFAKSQMTPENMFKAKEEILELVNEQLENIKLNFHIAQQRQKKRNY
ncbi:MAG: hypothetical protein IPJ37_10930 [Bacteroidales bacterium]|nr:hypothetical protein [Bacteroidales bacterium]